MEQYFTVEEAATLMKVSTETVRRWLRTGTVQGLKHGRDWRIPESALCTCGCEKCSEHDPKQHQRLLAARAETLPAENSPDGGLRHGTATPPKTHATQIADLAEPNVSTDRSLN